MKFPIFNNKIAGYELYLSVFSHGVSVLEPPSFPPLARQTGKVFACRFYKLFCTDSNLYVLTPLLKKRYGSLPQARFGVVLESLKYY